MKGVSWRWWFASPWCCDIEHLSMCLSATWVSAVEKWLYGCLALRISQGFLRNRASGMCIKRCVVRIWLVQWQRLRGPTVCPLQAGDPAEPLVWCSLSSQAWDPGGWWCEFWWGPVCQLSRQVTFSPRFVLSGPKGLDGAHPHGEGPLHLLPVQMLISCRNVLPNYPKHVWPNSWVTWDPVRSTQVVHRINHHTHFVDWGYLFIVELSEIFIYSRYKFLTDTCLHFRNKHF